jgi:excisionase family DNA binding protein
MTTKAIAKLLYRIPEACEATGYSRAFLYEQIASGGLKVIRVGRTTRICVDDLKNWVTAQKQSD